MYQVSVTVSHHPVITRIFITSSAQFCRGAPAALPARFTGHCQAVSAAILTIFDTGEMFVTSGMLFIAVDVEEMVDDG